MNDSTFTRFYTYILYRNGIPFYVGKGCGKRMYAHEACAKNHEKCLHASCRVIRQALAQGESITNEKVYEHVTEQEAFEREIALIAYGRAQQWPLVNQTKGGDGHADIKALDYPGFIAPDGTIYENVHNLDVFCVQHNLQKSNMCLVNAGLQVAHKGWTRYPAPEEKPSRTYIHSGLIAPDGTVYANIINLTAFCKERGLQHSGAILVMQGKQHDHKGWTRYPPLETPAKRKRRVGTYTGFVSPEGVVYENVVNLRAFCREHGLESRNMHILLRGQVYHHQGWTTYPPRLQEKTPNAQLHQGFVSPEGVVCKDIVNLAAFCREHGLEKTNMSAVERGKVRSCKGWTKYTPPPLKDID